MRVILHRAEKAHDYRLLFAEEDKSADADIFAVSSGTSLQSPNQYTRAGALVVDHDTQPVSRLIYVSSPISASMFVALDCPGQVAGAVVVSFGLKIPSCGVDT